MTQNSEEQELEKWAREWRSETEDDLVKKFDRCADLKIEAAIPFAATYAALPAESNGATNWSTVAARRFLKKFSQDDIDAAIDASIKINPSTRRTLKIVLSKALE